MADEDGKGLQHGHGWPCNPVDSKGTKLPMVIQVAMAAGTDASVIDDTVRLIERMKPRYA